MRRLRFLFALPITAGVLSASSGCAQILGIDAFTDGPTGGGGSGPGGGGSGGGGPGGGGTGGGANPCGNGLPDDGEDCDDGNTDNTDGCLATCVKASCGDKFVQKGVEDCDDGNDVDTDDCPGTCASPTCGDGFAWAGHELCDDGNDSNDDACTTDCAPASCGDGAVQPPEECDDDNDDDTDACLSSCINAFCGDGKVQVGVDECDDGNAVNEDHCVMGCKMAECGDGYVETGIDGCDDGNGDDTDDCPSTCVVAFCGDGFTQAGVDECDDGNDVDDDGCTNACTAPKCGDGITQASVGEGCDDGNLTGGDGCGRDCQYAVQISAGGVHTCAVMSNQRVKCWGYQSFGQCGVPTEGNGPYIIGDSPNQMGSNLPYVDLGTQGGLPLQVEQVSAGADHTCALIAGGKVKCWGANNYGKLGYGDSTYRGDTAADMGNNLPFVQLGNLGGVPLVAIKVVAGDRNTCVLFQGGRMKCWGDGTSGALGINASSLIGDNPGETGDGAPLVQDTDDIGQISVRGSTTCAFSQLGFGAGLVKCWGYNISGQLGIGTLTDEGQAAGDMAALLGLGFSGAFIPLGVSVGGRHVCAYSGTGIKCWGENGSGQLGVGSVMDQNASASALSVNTGFSAVAIAGISTGTDHTCAWSSQGQVRCWGDNGGGRLGIGNVNTIGDGAADFPLAAVDLGAGAMAVQVSAGGAHTCALLSDRRIKCWGGGAVLGLGTMNNRGDGAGEMGANLPAVEIP